MKLYRHTSPPIACPPLLSSSLSLAMLASLQLLEHSRLILTTGPWPLLSPLLAELFFTYPVLDLYSFRTGPTSAGSSTCPLYLKKAPELSHSSLLNPVSCSGIVFVYYWFIAHIPPPEGDWHAFVLKDQITHSSAFRNTAATAQHFYCDRSIQRQ